MLPEELTRQMHRFMRMMQNSSLRDVAQSPFVTIEESLLDAIDEKLKKIKP
jgi:hypothetical protein